MLNSKAEIAAPVLRPPVGRHSPKLGRRYRRVSAYFEKALNLRVAQIGRFGPGRVAVVSIWNPAPVFPDFDLAGRHVVAAGNFAGNFVGVCHFMRLRGCSFAKKPFRVTRAHYFK